MNCIMGYMKCITALTLIGPNLTKPVCVCVRIRVCVLTFACAYVLAHPSGVRAYLRTRVRYGLCVC